MKPSELYEGLHALISQRVPILIWSASGVGKSQIVRQAARELNWQFIDGARKFGGWPQDYQAIYDWFEESKSYVADHRHVLLSRHARSA